MVVMLPVMLKWCTKYIDIMWILYIVYRYSRHDKSWAFGVGVFCVYLDNGKQSVLVTTHTFPERSFRDLSKNVWVVALIVHRFRDKHQKHQHRRLNSYRGDYTFYLTFICASYYCYFLQSQWEAIIKVKCFRDRQSICPCPLWSHLQMYTFA